MRNKMKLNLISFIAVLLMQLVLVSSTAFADASDFAELEMSFKNFVKCELTRTDATNHFKGKPFTITMVDMFDIQNESGLKIITGAVQCFVVKRHITLYIAVGIKEIMETETVNYYTIRKKNFSILATELMKYPYKERCPWTQYWIDTD